MTNLEVLRPTSNLVIAWVIYLMSFMMTFTIATQSDQGSILIAASWAVAISVFAYLVFARPKVILFDEGIRIINPFLDITVGWHRVIAIDAKFTMSIVVGDKTIYAWAAPAPSRYHSRNVHQTDLRGMQIGSQGMIRAGESPRSHSGAATHLARRRMEQFHEKNLPEIESKLVVNNFGIALILLSSIAAIVLSYLQL